MSTGRHTTDLVITGKHITLMMLPVMVMMTMMTMMMMVVVMVGVYGSLGERNPGMIAPFRTAATR